MSVAPLSALRVAGIAVLLLAFPAHLTSQSAPLSTFPPPSWVAEPTFTQIQDVRETADGVLVADRAERRLVHVSWDQAVREIARTGRGPGEFRGVGSLHALPADSSLFVDSFDRRWLLLAGSEVVGTVAPQVRRGAGRVLGAAAATVLLESPLRPRPFTAPDSVLLVMLGRDGSVLRSIAQVEGPGSDGAVQLPARGDALRAMVSQNPLAAGDEAVLFDDGWVAVARAHPYRVDWLPPDGAWLRGPILTQDPVAVHRQHQCNAIARMFGGSRPCEPELFPGWPDVVPPFSRTSRESILLASPTGEVLVRRLQGDPQESRRFDVIGRDGRRSRTLSLAANEDVVGFGVSSIYTVSTSPLGLQTLRRHEWR